MKVFGKSSTISRAYFTPFAPSKYRHAKKKGGRSSYLTNTVYAAVAGDPSIIQLSDGTYKQRSANKRKKKDGTSLQKAFGKLSRKTKPPSPTASADKVLEAVTIQYPGFANGEGVELDLSFDTTATVDFSEELGIAEEIKLFCILKNWTSWSSWPSSVGIDDVRELESRLSFFANFVICPN